MRHLSRCLLCAFVCLSVLFSSSVCVYATDESDYISYEEFDYLDPNTPSLLDEEVIDTSKCKVTSAFYYNGQYHWNNFATAYYDVPNSVESFVVFYQMPTSIEKGTYNITIEYQTDNNITLTYANVVFQDKTGYQFQNAIVGEVIQTVGNRITLQFKNIEITKDAYTMSFNLSGRLQPTGNSSTTHLRLYTDKLVFEKKDDTSSLLDGIIGWVKNIYNGIIDLPSSIANSISGFFTWIVNAVNEMKNTIVNALTTLGNFIIDGIKGLFIPTTEDITNVKEQWDNLLEDRFGGLYQSIDIVHDMYESFTEQEKKTITVPKIQIPFGNNVVWTFGGWDVQIVPDGFTVLIEACKMAISIVCTLSFIQGLKNRFERLIGGQNA